MCRVLAEARATETSPADSIFAGNDQLRRALDTVAQGARFRLVDLAGNAKGVKCLIKLIRGNPVVGEQLLNALRRIKRVALLVQCSEQGFVQTLEGVERVCRIESARVQLGDAVPDHRQTLKVDIGADRLLPGFYQRIGMEGV